MVKKEKDIKLLRTKERNVLEKIDIRKSSINNFYGNIEIIRNEDT